MVMAIIGMSFTTIKPGKPEKVFYQDSVSNSEYIKRLITYNKIYPYIRYNQNYLEWQDYSAVDSFFEKLKQTPTRKLKILHIGDSHVQTDIFTGFIRNEMQKIFGDGGRGYVFPYAAAATHSAYDYKTSYTGVWAFSRNTEAKPTYDLGITGAAVHTADSSASFKFVFPSWALKDDFSVIKLYCKRSPKSFDLKIKASGVASPLYVDCNAFNDKLYIEIKLPKTSDTLEFFVNKTDTIQNFFECYGLLIETGDDKGILYNSVGINGASLKSILRENLMLYQLSELRPDAVIIDLGVNDIYKAPFYKNEIEKDLSKIIDIIQRSSPDAAIIISNPQDVYYKYWDETNCKNFSQLSREIAFKKGCAFYDYYNISGGQTSMLKWFSSGLAQPDKVHLTAPGYYVRGELMMNAILNSYSYVLKNGSKNEFLAAKEFPDTANIKVTIVSKNLPEIKDTEQVANVQKPKAVQTQTQYYKIKSGDNLGGIAQKYGVSVNQLKAWNGIKGTNISVGKTLTIYKQSYGTPYQTTKVSTPKTTTTTKTLTATNKSTTTTNKTTVSKPSTTQTKSTTKTGTSSYTVKSGDNLWGIAKKTNTTVDQIKKTNNLKSNDLKLGMILKISK
jgi:LysM repeat protein/lysophospholipase L1-like esterase